MSYQVLARKWRPKSFQQLVGQEHVSQALINGLDQERVHHAFLFTGTRGVGKTTIARILAKCLNCESGVSSNPCGECACCVDVDEGRFVDMLEIDAASRTGVDDMRELLESVQYTPTRGRYKVYIIDEVHMLSSSSFNALLKSLEEPPPHVKFVLATTDPQKVPVTILSRCLRFNLRRLLPEQIEGCLQMIVESEGVAAEPGALTCLSRAADGSMRDGLSLLDQAIAYGGGQLSQPDVEQMLGLIDHEHVATMIGALAAGDAAGLMAVVEELVAQSRDLEAVLLNLAEVLHRVSLVQCVPDYRDPERSDWDAIERLSGLLSPEDSQLFYQIAIKGREEMGLAPDPRTGLEMALLRMLAFRPAASRSREGEAGGGALEAGPRKSAGNARAKSRQPAVARPGPADKAGAGRGEDGGQKPAAAAEPAQDSLLVAPTGRDWVDIVGKLPVSGQVRELARNVELQSASGTTWDFLIPSSLRHLGSKACVDSLSRALSEEVGYPVTISLSDSKGRQLNTAAAISEQGVRQKMSDAERAIKDDPTVRALEEQMGARVVEDSIQPLQ